MVYSFKNTDNRAKAIPSKGGLATVKPGETLELETVRPLDQTDIERYAGLKVEVKEVGAEPAKKPKAAAKED